MLLKPAPKHDPKLELFKPKKRDIFDDEFDKLPAEEKLVHSPELKKIIEETVKQAVSQLRPMVVTMPETREIIRETPAPVAPKDPKTYAEESTVAELKTQIADLKKELAKVKQSADSPIVIPSLGGSGVIGIPPPEASTVGYVLTINAQGKAEWKVATGGSGGGAPSISGYTITNGVTLKALDVDDGSLAEVKQMLGTLITELQA